MEFQSPVFSLGFSKGSKTFLTPNAGEVEAKVPAFLFQWGAWKLDGLSVLWSAKHPWASRCPDFYQPGQDQGALSDTDSKLLPWKTWPKFCPYLTCWLISTEYWVLWEKHLYSVCQHTLLAKRQLIAEKRRNNPFYSKRQLLALLLQKSCHLSWNFQEAVCGVCTAWGLFLQAGWLQS